MKCVQNNDNCNKTLFYIGKLNRGVFRTEKLESSKFFMYLFSLFASGCKPGLNKENKGLKKNTLLIIQVECY